MDPLSPLVRNFEKNIGARRTPCAANHNSSDTIKLIKIINESRMFQTYLKDVLFWEVLAEIVKI